MSIWQDGAKSSDCSYLSIIMPQHQNKEERAMFMPNRDCKAQKKPPGGSF